MIAPVLALSTAAGIVWADQARGVPEHFAILSLMSLTLAGVVASGLLVQIRRGRKSSAASLRLAAFASTAGLAFIVGFDGLAGDLDRAWEDARRVQAMRDDGIRLADAVVHSRRSSRWGDQVELVSVRAVDGGRSLPETLRLAIGQAGRGRLEAPSTSRAERLLWPGAHVRLGLRVSALRGARNPGGRDPQRRFARRGLAARARLVKPNWVISLSAGGLEGHLIRPGIDRARQAWRKQASDRLARFGDAGGLVLALGLGDRGAIRPKMREAFRRLGLSHLLAVSGLHVGFVAGLAAWLSIRAQSCWRSMSPGQLPMDWALLAACGAATFYAWLTGASISVERAAMLFVLCAVCRLCLRRVDPSDALCWVAMLLLWLDPAALFDVGAQLSFAACGGLIATGLWQRGQAGDEIEKRADGPGERIRTAVLSSFRASLSVCVGTAMLLAYHGIPMSMVAPFSNLLGIPWLGLLVLPISLLVVFTVGWIPDVLLVALMGPVSLFASALAGAAGVMPESMPGGRWPVWILLPLIAVALRWIRRNDWGWALCAWIVISLVGIRPGLSGPISLAPPQVIFFDVGQGDAALVQGRGTTLVIDTGSGPADGSGGEDLVRGLRAAGVESIDVLALSHGDLDHRAGTARVLDAFRVEELWLPISAVDDESLLGFAVLAEARGTHVLWQSTASTRRVDRDLEIEVLWPRPDATAATSRNETALVLRVVLDDLVHLFTSDIGVDVERALLAASSKRLKADVLKVAHHGSRHSSNARFLAAVSPDLAVVSAPCDPTRGLPTTAALQRLSESGAALWWTGRDGAVVTKRDVQGNVNAGGWGERRDCASRD